jgi:serine/threonine-protein kinase
MNLGRPGPSSTALDRLFLDFQSALAGRYSLERELGRGGMGVVYLARDVRLDRPVAIKLLPPARATDGRLRERFLREARTAAKLSHPNIVPIHAVDEVGEFVFFAMAYVQGETLAQRVSARGPLRPAEAARVLREVAWALAYAHGKGVIHRDIKPENILLDVETGRAMVADFGIAHLIEASRTTGAGEVIGTPEFMSPEQASGVELDGRSDLYSLGVVGFYALAGRLPFSRDDAAAVLVQQLTHPAPPLVKVAPGVPGRLGSAVDRCLAKSPGDRFTSGEALAEALDSAMATSQGIPAPVRVFLKMAKFFALLSGAGAGASVLLAGVLLETLGSPAGSPPPEFVLWQVAAIVFLLAFGPAGIATQARRLLKGGYGADDVAAACQANLERSREETALMVADGLRRERQLKALAALAGSVFVASATGLLLLPASGLTGALGVICVLAAAVTITSVFTLEGVRYVSRTKRSGWARFWRGWPGRWLFRVAGVGLREPLSLAGSHPTELVIASAAGALFDALPKRLRRVLPGFPDVVRGLERRAQQIRQRIEELSRALAEEGEGPRYDRAAAQQDALAADLQAARNAAQQQLAQVVAGLETLRLGLLRLRAGAGTLESITAELGAAGELGEAVDTLLDGRREADGVLAPKPTPGRKTPGVRDDAR